MDAVLKAGKYVNKVDELITSGRPTLDECRVLRASVSKLNAAVFRLV